MAANLRDTAHDEDTETHEINVTPFIDVILVLMIIFMVAAPLATVDVNVDLPASTSQAADRPDKPIFVTLKEDLSLALGNDPISSDGLLSALDAATEGNKDTRIFLRADKTVDYGAFMETLNRLRDAGYLKIGLVGLASSATSGAAANGQ